jgi:integrase
VSSVHKLPGKPNWICFYTDHDGKRRTKSTMTTDKREAERLCNEIQKIEDKARSGKLTPDRARLVIESTVSDIMESLGTTIERKTTREHFEGWAKSVGAENSEGTYKRYAGVVTSFLAFMGAKAGKSLTALSSEDIERYRESLTGKVANATVNTHLKVLRICLEKAVKQHIFHRNPARMIDNLDASKRHHRRAFTQAELRKLLENASGDWKTAILFGIYTGLRLSDIANLTWTNLDLQRDEITIATQKTGRTQILPLAKPLRRHIDALPAGDDPKAPLMMSLAGNAESGLSNQFYELMASAGLVASRVDHRKQKQGRSMKRAQSEITFHSLRHTATSLLKNAGVSDVVARDLIGHDSVAVSRNYTHIDTETKRAAVDKMPDFTK